MKTQTMINLKIYTTLLALKVRVLRRLPVLRGGSSANSLTASACGVVAGGSSLIVQTSSAAPSREAPLVMIVGAGRGSNFRLDRYLEQAGFQVLPAETVAEAAVLLSHGDVRLVLLDLQDGDDDGTDSIEQLQLHAGRPRIPTIVLTLRTDSEARVAALLAGADDCLAKPASPEEVLARVRAVLRWSPGVGQRFVPAGVAPVP
jgi:CheY-like chemotaxis protein